MKKYFLSALGFLFLVGLALAANNLFDVTDTIGQLIGIITTILVSIAVIILIYGVISYVIAGGDEEKAAKARSTIIYGVIGLFVIIAMWGLANILKNTFVDQNTVDPLPCIPGTYDATGNPC